MTTGTLPAESTTGVCGLARNLDEVLEAWRLVYRVYRQACLIMENSFGMHGTPFAIGEHGAVITRWESDLMVGTMSSFLEREGRLPLDQIYHAELEALREQGRRLAEVGLYADMAHWTGSASINGLFGMMRLAMKFAWFVEADDIVIGVHPRHAPFYIRCWGFERIGEERAYPRVRGHPAVLLRLERSRTDEAAAMHRGLRYCIRRPTGPELFERRCRFTATEVSGSLLYQYLESCGMMGLTSR